MGWVNEDTRVALLGGASVLAYPSIYEGFGFPPLEAMAAGVPVVATRAGAVPEVVGRAAALVEVGDVEAMAKELVRALDDTSHRDDLIAAGYRRVNEFSWQKCVDGLLMLYGDAARGATR
jgi:glycosyltransferase involved in cell wall biosynthesis